MKYPQSTVYRYVLGFLSGGTDIISCFAGQNPTVPVYRGEIQTRNLGMAMECWSQDGKNYYTECCSLIL